MKVKTEVPMQELDGGLILVWPNRDFIMREWLLPPMRVVQEFARWLTHMQRNSSQQVRLWERTLKRQWLR